MLTAITLQGFKSYQAARLPLAPLTVLIGANASGKSNAIEGLRILAWLAQGQKLSNLPHALQNGGSIARGRIEDLAFRGSETFGLGCETDLSSWNRLSMTFGRREDGLHLISESLTSGEKWLYELRLAAEGRGTEIRVVYNPFAKGPAPRITCSDQMAIFTQLTSPAPFAVQHKKSQTEIPQQVAQYERWLSSILFLDPAPSRMRDYSHPSDLRFQGNGTNLSSILYHLWGTEDAEPYRTQRAEILSFIRSLPEQDISDLGFLHEPRGGVLVKLTETFGGEKREYDASLLSDGTLRVLAIAAALLWADDGSLVVIEEIDNGVHPSRARHLLAQIRAIAERRRLRVLLSTHNPALLDALPDSAVPDVVFCYRDPASGGSRLVRLADVPDYPELIAQGTLGHLATSGLLERFVKGHPTGAERKARALACPNGPPKGAPFFHGA